MTLTEFLLARIAEDKAVALDAAVIASRYDKRSLSWRWMASHDGGFRQMPTTHSPARVLAECAAKRRIVANHGGRHVCEDGLAGERWDDDANDIVEAPCEDLRIIGAVYSDHPDYDEAWAR